MTASRKTDARPAGERETGVRGANPSRSGGKGRRLESSIKAPSLPSFNTSTPTVQPTDHLSRTKDTLGKYGQRTGGYETDPARTIDQGGQPENPSISPPEKLQGGHNATTPMQALRRKCIDCTAGEYSRITGCRKFDCQLFPLRMGRRPKGSRPLKNIRAYCRDFCANSQFTEVTHCTVESCSLRPYRFGHRPKQEVGHV